MTKDVDMLERGQETSKKAQLEFNLCILKVMKHGIVLELDFTLMFSFLHNFLYD